MNSIVLKIMASVVWILLLNIYRKKDYLKMNYNLIVILSLISLMSVLFLSFEEIFVLNVLLFHVYTDEMTQTVYCLPTFITGIVELVLLIISGVKADALIMLLVVCGIVKIISFLGAFAEGDADFIYVLLIFMARYMEVFEAFLIITLVSAISFIVKILLINVKRILCKQQTIRKSAYMGSIMVAYLVICNLKVYN